jgi:hypothetical protein
MTYLVASSLGVTGGNHGWMHRPPDPLPVIDLIEAVKLHNVAAGVALAMLQSPDGRAWVAATDIAAVTYGRSDGSSYGPLPVAPALDAATSGFNLDYLGGWLTLAVSWVGDALASHSYFTRSPELEFFRHLRNAVSHGNRWHFRPGEPRRPARHATFVLDASMHGSNALFEYLAPGDVFDLLDEISAQLRDLAAGASS